MSGTYGQIGANQMCPDYQVVLSLQLKLIWYVGMWIMQVSTFSSVITTLQLLLLTFLVRIDPQYSI